MPAVKLKPGQSPPTALDLDLLGPLGMAGAGAKLARKVVTPELIDKLLGRPIEIGRRLLKLSSANPAKNLAVVHDDLSAARHQVPLDEFVQLYKSHGADSPRTFDLLDFPEPLARRASKARDIGPRGGLIKKKAP